MSALAVKLGVVAGMAATATSFFPLLKLLMGHCFFEQGCGEHEKLELAGVAFASCLVGLFAGWAVSRLVRRMQ